jgi:2-aminobenzoate-CoA ligase
VAIRSTNRPEATIAYLAAWRIGAIVVLVPAAVRSAELAFFLNDTLAKVLVVANGGPCIEEFLALERVDIPSVTTVVVFPDAAGTDYDAWNDVLGEGPVEQTWPAFSSDAVAVVWDTGVTTGVPKACYHTARRLVMAAECSVDAYGVTPDDVHLFPAPVGHAAGWLSRTTFSLLRGITQIEIEDFSNPHNVLRAIGENGVTWMIGMGATWAQMLPAYEAEPERYDLSSIERAYAPFITSNGEWLHRAWRKHGLNLLNPMGSTAFAAWFFVPSHSDEDLPATSVAHPAAGWEARLVAPNEAPLRDVTPGEVGQLAIRGVSGLTYWNRPELQARDVREGWTVVDDLLRLDSDGYYRYMGRSDMMICPGGHKVAPVEVEEALSAHGSVAEVAVTAAPDPRLGETVMAWVVPAAGVVVDDELRSALQKFVKSRLAPYKYPRRIVFLESLPRDPLGKIVMKQLAAWARAGEPPAEAPILQDREIRSR